ncbi:Rne/Rng family ribonuclease [Allopusillimonas ginsengisoli]|uniref:Rne/Rng family ribonuclease n=1 Tax=Allopusillimonas ginsengisoli TaxID=453575 RepID=UPI001020F084|nr:Rne/Rng family ribonuclease [Allopusillimonas ginsengisoli]TEA78531.1 Rne/Rng family ribonuclease [Allopusillimonas ginsengisoli]
MKRMLFNATHQEELRVAIVDGQKLIDLDIETAGREQRKGNIYKGVITRIEPGLEACFVSYGEERHGFLPFKEVARGYFKEGVDVRSARIQDALTEGQELIIQVEKEERGNKGAALTTFISLAGRYLVLMPNNPRGGGVSRRVEGEDRQELRETMDQLDLPAGMSIIARTAGIGRSVEELQWDLSYLMQLWGAIDVAAKENSAPILIYLESSLVIRAIRDYYSPDIGEILIDTDDIFEQATAFMSVVMPDSVQRVKMYRDDIPLFSRFQIEHQIETAYSRTVQLPSGGSVVIDHTEALVAVDVNSARSTRGSDIEETAMRTNLEAADEVARQLRLRDLGGLIVIDFIDMEDSKNQRAVEQRLRDALHFDRARVQMGKISRFGLMELSRQRLRPALNEGSHITCPRCNGTGVIRDAESSALHVLRLLQEEAMKEGTAALHAQVPVDVATFLLNEKRHDIAKIESRLKVNLILIPNKNLETPHHHIERLRHDDTRLEENKTSFELAAQPETPTTWAPNNSQEAKARPEALVKSIAHSKPAPRHAEPQAKPAAVTHAQGPGLIKRLLGWLTGTPATPAVQEESVATETKTASGSRGRHGRGGDRRDRGANDRNRQRRGERRPDAEKSELAAAPKTRRQAGQEGARNAEEQRPTAAPAAAAETGNSNGGRGRNRRGRGRNRRDETATDTTDAVVATATVANGAAAPIAATPVEADESRVYAEAATADSNLDTSTDSRPQATDGEQTDPERKRRRRRSRRGRRSNEGETGAVGVEAATDQHDNDQGSDSHSDRDSDDRQTADFNPAVLPPIATGQGDAVQPIASAAHTDREAPVAIETNVATHTSTAPVSTEAATQPAAGAAPEPVNREASSSQASLEEQGVSATLDDAAGPTDAATTALTTHARDSRPDASEEAVAEPVAPAFNTQAPLAAGGSPDTFVETVTAVESAEGVEPVKAVDAGETVEAAKTIDTAEAVETAKAADTAEPVETVQAVEAAEPVEPAKAVGAGETVETAKAVDTAEAVETAKAVDIAEPVETVKVADTAGIEETVKAEAQDTIAAMPDAEMDETDATAEQHDTAINGNSHPLDRVLADAGMQLIETRHTPAPIVTQPPARLGRARKTVTVIQDEPLQQVETH